MTVLFTLTVLIIIDCTAEKFKNILKEVTNNYYCTTKKLKSTFSVLVGSAWKEKWIVTDCKA